MTCVMRLHLFEGVFHNIRVNPCPAAHMRSRFSTVFFVERPHFYDATPGDPAMTILILTESVDLGTQFGVQFTSDKTKQDTKPVCGMVDTLKLN